MNCAADEYLVHEKLLEDHRVDSARAGEGAVCGLSDGSLYMVYGRFDGGRDEDRATLLEVRSRDGGLSWSEPKVLLAPDPEILNNMSVSLLNLKDGRIAMVYLRKVSTSLCYPVFMTSSDDAGSWSCPVDVASDRKGYYTVNNDRLVQLENGDILLPYSWFGESADFHSETLKVYCGCFLSRDGGNTWRRSLREITIEPENVVMPANLYTQDPDSYRHIQERRVQCQEPGVVDLGNRRVMMWCRTPGGYAYRAFSEDGGDTWGAFAPIPEFQMPCGPQSIKRIPGTARCLMLYNDRGEMPFGHPQFQWRRPLATAVSDDFCLHWKFNGLLEPLSVPSNCYYSIFFMDRNVVFTYYEGVMEQDPKGVFRPRNLASLKLKIIRTDYFMRDLPKTGPQGISGKRLGEER